MPVPPNPADPAKVPASVAVSRHVPTLTDVVEDGPELTERLVQEVLAQLRPEVERAVREALAREHPRGG